MAKIIGPFFATAGAVGLGSLMVVPVLVIAILATIGEGLGQFWPWMVALLIYGAMLAFLAWIVVEAQSQLIIAVGGALAPVLVLFTNAPNTWTTGLEVIFVAVVSFGIASIPCTSIAQQKVAAFGGIQLLWVAPAVFTCYGYETGQPNVLALITTVMGIIATIFATDM